ncbi:uncharacterized protein PV06_10337 [Exophiala oligosperma]|uniref:Major facilitator superfamily (MFS) profile domain-containing protein n=1 Tax=Exophiala oligosperma TaxID=215243 RepID=A0A0D2ABJ2_9EURO|nr:uncharacterized protein PV06_10337 [Exophiala oligosperma]KIW37706.1 hypothetical protein PV06_10337 [Exophiala oligosperma]
MELSIRQSAARNAGEQSTQTSEENGQVSQANEVPARQLSPVDGGWPAWTVLIAGFIFEALLWGFPTSFGVFQNYYSKLPEFENANISVIGTMAQGLYYLGAPLAAMATKLFPKHQKHQIWIGWPFCVFGLLAASFANTFGQLVATQGVMYGFGFVTLSYPIISMLNEWWVARKGMAFGSISSASGLAGIAMPFIIESLLQKYGYRTTLRASAVGIAVLTGPLIPFLRGRLPPTETSVLARTNWSFLGKPLFWIYSISTLVQGLGFFFPAIYLPSYATAIGLNSTQGALLLAVMCIAQVLGQFAFGYLSDKKIPVSILAIVCSLMSTVATLAIWGNAKSEPLLLLFSLIYGFFSYGFGTMRVAMGTEVCNDPSSAVATYAIFVFLQGVGNVLVGPISAALLSRDIIVDLYAALGYRSLVIFIGSCMFGSGLIICLRYLSPMKREF